jgi:hypothetical protein
MKNKLLVLLLLFFSLSSFSQFIQREVIKGQIISESHVDENVTVFNISSNKGAVSDQFGYFSIYARPKDTLVFSSVVFKSKYLVLDEIDFKVVIVKVKLEEFINELDEVIVTPKTLSGILEKDSKNLKVTDLKEDIDKGNIMNIQVEGDRYSTLRNTTMPSDGTIMYGMDFIEIGKMIGKIFKKDKPENKVKFTSNKNFQEAVKDKFTYHFFTETLGLKKEEIGLFLSFCDTDPSVKNLLAVNKEIDLIDYLISKSKEYKKLPKK